MKGTSLAATLELHQAEERRTALRALLMRPLLTAADVSFAAVRRHADQLRPWLIREAGWVLQVDRDCARLFKRPADLGDGTRGVTGFDRRKYVLLCLACATLERAESQITLRGLGDDLIRLASAPQLATAGYQFGLDQAHERRELVQVCRFLIEWGALSRVAGDEEAFVARAANGGSDALYDVHRRVLASLLACTRGPSTFASGSEPASTAQRLESLVEEFVPDTPDARRTALRHSLARRLLDDPVVYFDELTDDARDYVTNQRGVLAARLAEASALHPEQRAEGMALVDPEGELSDVQLPAEGTLAHATLLVAQYLVDRPEFISETEVAAYLRRAADTYGRYWRKAEREPGAEIALARDTLAQLDKLRLISFRDGAVRARPALARYSLGDPTLQDARPRLI